MTTPAPTTTSDERHRPSKQRGVVVREGSRSVLLISAVGHAHGWVPHGLGLIKGYLVRTTPFIVHNLSLCVTFSEHLRRHHPALVPYDQQMGEWGSSFHEIHCAARYFGHADPEQLVRRAVVDYLEGADIFRAAPWDDTQPARPAMVEFHTQRILTFCRLVEEYAREQLRPRLAERPLVIGLSVNAQQVYTSALLARYCREQCPEAVLVYGGPAVTAATEARFLDMFPEIDCVVTGDGEEAMRLITTSVAADGTIPRTSGVRVRSTLPITKRPTHAPPPPLDTIPAPNWDELRDVIDGSKQPLTTWMGRGCSWGRCGFCSIPEFQRKLFNRSPQRIVDDLVALKERYGTHRFRFGDWEVNGSAEVLAELCALLEARNEGLEFWAEVNARNLSSELMAAMKRAGFVSLQVGLESFSTALLRKMRKPATLLENVQVLLYAQEHGIELFSNLLYNYPGEAPEELAETLAVIRRIKHLLRSPVTLVLLEFLLETDADVFGEVHGVGERVGDPYRFESACLPPQYLPDGPYYLRRWAHPVDPRWREVEQELEQCRRSEHQLIHTLESDGSVGIFDSRDGEATATRLAGAEAAVYRATLGSKITQPRILAESSSISAAEVDRYLDAFDASGWILRDRQHVLALSVPRPSSEP